MLINHYDVICAIMYSPFESCCILIPFVHKGHFGHFNVKCYLILNFVHAHIMICDECICDILLIYVPRRSFIALFARFRKSRILLGFEHLKSISWDLMS